MIYIVSAAAAHPEPLPVRGQRLLQTADVVIYAGSLVNPALLKLTKPSTEIHNSASMTL